MRRALLSTEGAACPLCNKGTIEKPNTRKQKKEFEWFSRIEALKSSGSPLKYLRNVNQLLQDMILTKNIHNYEVPKRFIHTYNSMLDEIIYFIIEETDQPLVAARNIDILVENLSMLGQKMIKH